MKLIELLERKPKLYSFVQFIYKIPIDIKVYVKTNKRINSIKNSKKVIFYLGVPVYSNLGDLAQGMCIRRWIGRYFPNYDLCEIETNALVHTHFSLINKLKKVYNSDSIIIFQSGYTTTDLGGYADEMHRAVFRMLPEAKYLMMPQTVFFQSNKNRMRSEKAYNLAKNMLFLARDRISYQTSLEMFRIPRVELFPDIVTSLIGTVNFKKEKKGVMFCCREDSEKYYTDKEINGLIDRCKRLGPIERTDTTKKNSRKWIVSHAEQLIWNEIEEYSRYRVVVTDRYHGTIFSLIAGTPVVILRTTDHKVTTGADWFKGVYDDYVFTADSIDDAYEIVLSLMKKDFNKRNEMKPYFEMNYYNKLANIFIGFLEGKNL